MIYPNKAYSTQFKSERELKTGFHDQKTWQPAHLNIKFKSSSGCGFSFGVVFPEEEKREASKLNRKK